MTVATSDGLEQIIITGQGCRLFSAREFEQEILSVNSRLREQIEDFSDHSKNRPMQEALQKLSTESLE